MGFKIFQVLVRIVFLGLMAMLYWSSTLIESNLRNVQNDLLQVKNDLMILKSDLHRSKKELLDLFSKQELKPKVIPIEHSSKNLLTDDPFYINTLPKLLPADFKPLGIRKEAELGKPQNLHPFTSWSHVVAWHNLCSVAIAGQAIGIYETFTPDMALSMEIKELENGQLEYWLNLRKDVFWQPLNPNHFSSNVVLADRFLKSHQVTAHDFKFYFDAVMNPHVEESKAVVLRLFYEDVEEIRVEDDFTLVVRWKTKKIVDSEGKEKIQVKYASKSLTDALRPLPRFVYQYFADGTKIIEQDEDPNTYRTNPVWAQNFAHHWAQNVIVSCGPWLFDGLTDREIRFRRNSDFYDPLAVLVDAFEIKFRDSPDAIWDEFKSGSIDLLELPPNLMAEYERFLQTPQARGVKRLNYLGRSYSYVGWNEARPFFKSAKVRQALTMAIDRDRIIRQNLNGMGQQTTGTFFPYSQSYDPNIKPYPYDPHRARQYLKEEGWTDEDGDGVLEKMIDGQKKLFKFTLLYFVKSPTVKAIVDYIVTALKQIGIVCIPNGVDIADLSRLFEDKEFDAVLMGWALGTPPEEIKDLWHSRGAQARGSSNAIGFSNAEVDRIADQLEYEFDPKKRIELYHRFNAILYEEAPYTFLYTPKVSLVYRDYLQNVFIPVDRQDLIPGANVGEPQPSIFWIKMPGK